MQDHTANLTRLLSPKTLAVVGGGAWCAAIIDAARQIGFEGTITPVHPKASEVAGLPALRSVAEIAHPIDAAFIGVNRHATIEVVGQLRAAGAGGAICFASGFAEAQAEDAQGSSLQAELLTAAGDMPILGPNCYGFLNALDQTGIWPDQHGMTPVDRGVAILTQSSNIAINLTMQARGLPIGVVVTCGNQAQTDQTTLARHLLADPRITAIGLHVEGMGDLRGWQDLARAARAAGKPLIALKSGRSAQARAATVSHTASLAGSDSAADALFARLGIARAENLPVFLEALKLAHVFGVAPQGAAGICLPGAAIGSISCSGGEAALAADTAVGTSVTFPPLNDVQTQALRAALGPMVALANPLDYHTYVWRDEAAMTRAWAAMADPALDLILVVLDYPRADLCDPADWDIATRAVCAAARQTGTRYGVVATLPELMPEATSRHLMEAGVMAFNGLDHAIAAIDLMGRSRPDATGEILLPGAHAPDRPLRTLTEVAAKAAMAACGLRIPDAQVFPDQATAAEAVTGPCVLKVQGLAHKTGARGLALDITSPEAARAADLAPGPVLVEEMVTGAVAELLVGVTRDPAHGFLLTLAAGGTATELWDDKVNLLVPASRAEVARALDTLRLAPLLHGYRGAPAANIGAVLDAVAAIQAYVTQTADTVEEVEVNPLLCTPRDAIAVDALIRLAET